MIIAKLRTLGYDGPHSGGKHQFMRRGTHKLRIPNPHRGDPGVDDTFMRRWLKQVPISENDWMDL